MKLGESFLKHVCGGRNRRIVRCRLASNDPLFSFENFSFDRLPFLPLFIRQAFLFLRRRSVTFCSRRLLTLLTVTLPGLRDLPLRIIGKPAGMAGAVQRQQFCRDTVEQPSVVGCLLYTSDAA